MSPKPTMLLFGFGARTGVGIAAKFSSAGYNVAVVGRSLSEGLSKEDYLGIKEDLAETSRIPGIFNKVKSQFGAPPNTVIYSGGQTMATISQTAEVDYVSLILAYGFESVDPSDPLAIPTARFEHALNINITSAYAAAGQAVKGFADLPSDMPKTFVYIGNKNSDGLYLTSMMAIGVGKSGGSFMIAAAAKAYEKKGYSFYYADQRTPEGDSVMQNVSGEAHGDFLIELASKKEQGPWQATFVKGKGYVKM